MFLFTAFACDKSCANRDTGVRVIEEEGEEKKKENKKEEEEKEEKESTRKHVHKQKK